MVFEKHDKNTNAFYLNLHDAKVADSAVDKRRFMDISTDGKIIGIEILDLK